MFTLKSTQFNLEGFTMVLLASFIGGIRWTLTQLLMQKAELGESDSKSVAQGQGWGEKIKLFKKKSKTTEMIIVQIIRQWWHQRLGFSLLVFALKLKLWTVIFIEHNM